MTGCVEDQSQSRSRELSHCAGTLQQDGSKTTERRPSRTNLASSVAVCLRVPFVAVFPFSVGQAGRENNNGKFPCFGKWLSDRLVLLTSVRIAAIGHCAVMIDLVLLLVVPPSPSCPEARVVRGLREKQAVEHATGYAWE